MSDSDTAAIVVSRSHIPEVVTQGWENGERYTATVQEKWLMSVAIGEERHTLRVTSRLWRKYPERCEIVVRPGLYQYSIVESYNPH